MFGYLDFVFYSIPIFYFFFIRLATRRQYRCWSITFLLVQFGFVRSFSTIQCQLLLLGPIFMYCPHCQILVENVHVCGKILDFSCLFTIFPFSSIRTILSKIFFHWNSGGTEKKVYFFCSRFTGEKSARWLFGISLSQNKKSAETKKYYY